MMIIEGTDMKHQIRTPANPINESRMEKYVTYVHSFLLRFSMVCYFAFLFINLIAGAYAQENRYALVIGNGAYKHVTKLTNSTNDAKDIAKVLNDIGFSVDLLVDSDLSAMENAVVRLGRRLATSANTVGFFYYAGHGVQSAGTNYFIPTEADIPSATFLKQKSLSLESVLDTLHDSGNKLNIVVLDACRDNPFSWSRSGTRGLTVVEAQPPGSIIVYATSAGSVALEGQGRNGVFTGELLKNMRSPGTDIADVFKQTGAAVSADTAGSQIPAVYTQFFGSYALVAAALSIQSAATPKVAVTALYGSLVVTTATEGTLYLDGKALSHIAAGINTKIDTVEVGGRSVELRYADGHLEQHNATVEMGRATTVTFGYRKAPPSNQVWIVEQEDFYKLVQTGTAQNVQAAISNGANVKAKNKSGSSPLLWAAMFNPNPEVIDVLLKAGAYIDVQDNTGQTPLMFAAGYNPNPEVITKLLKAGADMDKAESGEGMTALMYAALANSNPEAVTVLLEAGADAKAKNDNGETAFDYAKCNGPQKLDRVLSLCITCLCPKGVTHETKAVRWELQGAHSP
jgi:uncharacterized caspase-like protein